MFLQVQPREVQASAARKLSHTAGTGTAFRSVPQSDWLVFHSQPVFTNYEGNEPFRIISERTLSGFRPYRLLNDTPSLRELHKDTGSRYNRLRSR